MTAKADAHFSSRQEVGRFRGISTALPQMSGGGALAQKRSAPHFPLGTKWGNCMEAEMLWLRKDKP